MRQGSKRECLLRLQMAHDQALEQRQLSVKEMPHLRNHGNRQYLRACPVHDGRQLDGVIGLAMNDQRAVMRCSGHGRHLKAAGSGANEHGLGYTAFIPQRGQRMVLFDPNARPSLIADPLIWRKRRTHPRTLIWTAEPSSAAQPYPL